MAVSEAQKRASRKYRLKHKQYYTNKSNESMKKIRIERKEYKNKIDKTIEYIEHERFKRKILLGFSESKYIKYIFDDILEILKGEE